jgi:hypothetical protein
MPVGSSEVLAERRERKERCRRLRQVWEERIGERGGCQERKGCGCYCLAIADSAAETECGREESVEQG